MFKITLFISSYYSYHIIIYIYNISYYFNMNYNINLFQSRIGGYNRKHILLDLYDELYLLYNA